MQGLRFPAIIVRDKSFSFVCFMKEVEVEKKECFPHATMSMLVTK